MKKKKKKKQKEKIMAIYLIYCYIPGHRCMLSGVRMRDRK
jgi:hypothetical protein